MANPRQRKKSRAGNVGKRTGQALRRLHKQQNKFPALRGPEALQAKWDKKLTVFQNYKALGLLPSIPLPSQNLPKPRYASSLNPDEAGTSASHAAAIQPIGFGRIIRDEKGNVIDIILPEELKGGAADGEGDDQDGEEGEEEDSEEESGVLPPVEPKTDIVRTLEQLAASTTHPVIRYTSTAELSWLQSLVVKHGDDYNAMFRDRKGNVWQKTEGEIKRMIKKAGGVEKIKASAAAQTSGAEAMEL